MLVKNIEVLIDDDSIDKVGNYYWHLHPVKNKTYIRGRVGDKLMYLHRFILDAPAGLDVDHINGNTFDNRKENLRLCNRSQNNINRPNTKGYYFNKNLSKYQSEIWVYGKKTYLGLSLTEEEAREKYENAVHKYYPGFLPKTNIANN